MEGNSMVLLVISEEEFLYVARRNLVRTSDA